MALDNGKDVVDSTKVIHVESVDETMNNVLTRDSAMEMELLELFEDITLEEVVANRACVGKVIGCVLGFFFENEDDCAFVLDKRPWLVNGVLLNLKPWPVEREVGSFVMADDQSKTELVRRGYIRAWIDVWVAHPFPAGFFLTADGKSESWVQFKYEKIPHLCFNCGRLANWDKICHSPMAMLTPKTGKAVQMYGEPEATRKVKELVSAVERTSAPEVVSCHSPRTLHDCTDSYDGVEVRNDRENVRNRTVGRCKVDDVAVQTPPRGELEARVLLDIGPNFLNLPQPDFALAQQSLICNSLDLSEMINHLLGNNRKRKAHCWLQPFPASPHFELPDCPVKEKSSDQDEIGAFCMGSTEKGEGSIGNSRGKKPKGKEKKSVVRKFSGVKTRSGRKKIIALDDLEFPGGFVLLGVWVFNATLLKPLNMDSKLKLIWEMVADCDSPWVVIGDLNVISNGSEKAGGRRYNRNEGELLNNFLFETGGVDLGCDGGCFTWQNSRVACNRVRKRLDRAIADANWCMDFSRARVSSFPILGSDHAPIVLNVWGDHAKLKYPFRFLEVWTTKARIAEEVIESRLVVKQAGPIQNEPINDYNIMKEAEIQLEILSTEENMNRIWKQKSREGWLRFGDDNTKFFHKSTLIRRRRNFMGCVNDDTGEWVRDRTDIGKMDNDEIGRVPSAEEVRDTVFKMHPLKAPGPDGYPGILDKEVNRTFICLIPKGPNATKFELFWPISLCNFGYKIISRIITDRLKGVIDPLVSPFQFAFLPGRSIAECSIVAQEVLHTIKHKKGKGGLMAIKTDMSKAYDRLEWSFLLRVLRANGFSSLVCNLIMQCVTTINFSILLNSAPLLPSILSADSARVTPCHHIFLSYAVRPWIPSRKEEEIKLNFKFKKNQPLLQVKDLFVEGTRMWNEQLIRECFNGGISNDILIIKPLTGGTDIVFWNAAKSGKFSVKSAYWASQQYCFNTPNKLWEKWWKLRLHPRLKFLGWKILSDILPTSARLGLREVEHRNCVFCNLEAESSLHLFCHCSVTRACMCDTLWKWRNDMIFKNDGCDVERVFRDWVAVVCCYDELSSNPWIVVDFSMVSGVLEGELLGIQVALKEATERRVRKIKIESDSKVAVLAFESGSLPYGWGTYPLFSLCLDLRKSFKDVVISFIPQLENGLADSLARWARESRVKTSGLLRDVAPSCGY
uniref:Reverse transcriptase n=1 Tax=Cannabis sativa TaxID=3483 RepID=A0A803PJF5_CANSA